jgi:hypothetical protein
MAVLCFADGHADDSAASGMQRGAATLLVGDRYGWHGWCCRSSTPTLHPGHASTAPAL